MNKFLFRFHFNLISIVYFLSVAVTNIANAESARSCSYIFFSKVELSQYETKIAKTLSQRASAIVAEINRLRKSSSHQSFEGLHKELSRMKKVSPIILDYIRDQSILNERQLVQSWHQFASKAPNDEMLERYLGSKPKVELAWSQFNTFTEIMQQIEILLDASSKQPKKGSQAALEVMALLTKEIKVPEVSSLPLADYGIENRASWENSIDYQDGKIDPNGRYFVFTIDQDSSSWISKVLNVLLASVNGLEVSDQFWMNLIDNPNDLAKKPFVTLSYLGPERRATYRSVGFVVYVPPENVLRTRVEDYGGFTFAGEKMIQSFLQHPEVMPPEELLINTLRSKNNEVHVYGTHPKTGRKIKVVGVIFNPNWSMDRKKISDEETGFWHQWAQRHRVAEPFQIHDGSSRTDTNDAQRFIAAKIVKNTPAFPANEVSFWESKVNEGLNKFKLARGYVVLKTDHFFFYSNLKTYFEKHFEVVPAGSSPTGQPLYRLELKKEIP